jgi:hypothetical protein
VRHEIRNGAHAQRQEPGNLSVCVSSSWRGHIPSQSPAPASREEKRVLYTNWSSSSRAFPVAAADHTITAINYLAVYFKKKKLSRCLPSLFTVPSSGRKQQAERRRGGRGWKMRGTATARSPPAKTTTSS